MAHQNNLNTWLSLFLASAYVGFPVCKAKCESGYINPLYISEDKQELSNVDASYEISRVEK